LILSELVLTILFIAKDSTSKESIYWTSNALELGDIGEDVHIETMEIPVQGVVNLDSMQLSISITHLFMIWRIGGKQGIL